MSRLCVVPARGGSKRFPGKNKALLGGKPLILHTLDVAEQFFDRVIFTSDSEELLKIAEGEGYNNVICMKRPPGLATDKSKVIDTVQWIAEQNSNFDSIWLSLPTCPFKKLQDFQIAATSLEIGETFNYCVSVMEWDFPPSLALDMGDQGAIKSVCPSKPWEIGHSRSQDHRTCFRPNGAIYGAKMDRFLENPNWYQEKGTYGLIMPRERSVDIDTELDLVIAEAMLKKGIQ